MPQLNQKPNYDLNSYEALELLYGKLSAVVAAKELDYLDKNSQKFIAASPFLVLATTNNKGELDCSPRGDKAGFVAILDERTLLLPDRKGNNRTDSLKNVIENPRVGLLFFVPNVNETFRVNGTAKLSIAPELLEHCAVEGKLPKSVMVISVEEAYIHCSRALNRSELWNPEKEAYVATAKEVPTLGTFLKDLTKGMDEVEVDAKAYDTYVTEELSKDLF